MKRITLIEYHINEGLWIPKSWFSNYFWAMSHYPTLLNLIVRESAKENTKGFSRGKLYWYGKLNSTTPKMIKDIMDLDMFLYLFL